MQHEPEENVRQGADPLGDRLRMSEARLSKTRGSSTNSSSQTQEVSESARMNGSDSEQTHTAKVVNLASWLSSPEAEQFFTSPKATDDERLIEFQLLVNISTYGRDKHMHSTAASMLRQMHTNGIHVDSVYIIAGDEREDVTEKYKDNHGRLWYEAGYNGTVVFDDDLPGWLDLT